MLFRSIELFPKDRLGIMILAIKAAGTKTSPYINAYMKLRSRLVRMIDIVSTAIIQ